jgi:uncharacterized protein (DUF433 family)
LAQLSILSDPLLRKVFGDEAANVCRYGLWPSLLRFIARFDRITCNSAILSGQPTIRGMRLSVRRVIEALAVSPNWDDLRREYPKLEPEDIRQALGFAARNLDESVQPLEPV